MPQGLQRRVGRNDVHFVIFCCYHRKRLLDSAGSRDSAERILDEVRVKYGFSLVGYVIMPEHVHLLVRETGAAPPSTIVQVFKQRVSRQMLLRLQCLFADEAGASNLSTCMPIRWRNIWCNIRASGRGVVGQIMSWEMES
jgi:REP element-mobilizing transposase RayT